MIRQMSSLLSFKCCCFFSKSNKESKIFPKNVNKTQKVLSRCLGGAFHIMPTKVTLMVIGACPCLDVHCVKGTVMQVHIYRDRHVHVSIDNHCHYMNFNVDGID